MDPYKQPDAIHTGPYEQPHEQLQLYIRICMNSCMLFVRIRMNSYMCNIQLFVRIRMNSWRLYVRIRMNSHCDPYEQPLPFLNAVSVGAQTISSGNEFQALMHLLLKTFEQTLLLLLGFFILRLCPLVHRQYAQYSRCCLTSDL